MIDGNIRVSVERRLSASYDPMVFIANSFSLDAPLYTRKNGDRISFGLAYDHDVLAHPLINNEALTSVSYLKWLGRDTVRRYAISFGAQAVFSRRDANPADLYFNSPFAIPTVFYVDPSYPQGYTEERVSITTNTANVGISLLGPLARNIDHIIGLGINNIIQNERSFGWWLRPQVGMDRQLSLTYGMNAHISRHIGLRPALVWLLRDKGTSAIMTGNEFMYMIGRPEKRVSIFAGIWLGSAKAQTVSVGSRIGSFRFAMGIDINGPHEGPRYDVALTYIHQGKNNKTRSIPCSRF